MELAVSSLLRYPGKSAREWPSAAAGCQPRPDSTQLSMPHPLPPHASCDSLRWLFALGSVARRSFAWEGWGARGRAFASKAACAGALLVGVPMAGLLGVSQVGCVRNAIPNTDVEDNEQNRKIIVFCEKYRRAVERKNVKDLLRMASPRYYEDGGNVDASDDLDFAGLAQYLQTQFQEASSIRYEIRYRRITQRERLVWVDYTYSASYRIPNETGAEEWHRKVDDNRLEIELLDDDEMKILAGM